MDRQLGFWIVNLMKWIVIHGFCIVSRKKYIVSLGFCIVSIGNTVLDSKPWGNESSALGNR